MLLLMPANCMILTMTTLYVAETGFGSSGLVCPEQLSRLLAVVTYSIAKDSLISMGAPKKGGLLSVEIFETEILAIACTHCMQIVHHGAEIQHSSKYVGPKRLPQPPDDRARTQSVIVT